MPSHLAQATGLGCLEPAQKAMAKKFENLKLQIFVVYPV